MLSMGLQHIFQTPLLMRTGVFEAKLVRQTREVRGRDQWSNVACAFVLVGRGPGLMFKFCLSISRTKFSAFVVLWVSVYHV